MKAEEKIKKVKELIRGVTYERFTPEGLYEELKNVTVFEIVEDFSDALNLINDIRDILEEKE